MQVELRKTDTKTQGLVETTKFSIPMSGKLMEILSDLYNDSRVAIVRELSSNMMDAVRTLPNAPAGIITLPSFMDPEISFEDFGIGMSHDTVVNVFAVYTASTKDQDNLNTGGWGLGGKSPFSYTTSWTLTSRWQGEERQYLMFKDAEGMSTCSLINALETQERNGVKIILPVQQEDISLFTRAAKYFAAFLPQHVKVLPSIDSLEDLNIPIEFSHHTVDSEGYGWSIPTDESMPQTAQGWKAAQKENRYYHGSRATIVLADVPYPLKELGNESCLEDLTGDLKFLTELPVLLYMPSGALNVVPSRDSIQNTPRSREQIQKAFKKILQEVERHVKEETDLCHTAQELWTYLDKNYIAKKTLGTKHRDRRFITVGTFHDLPEDGPWQADRWIDPRQSLLPRGFEDVHFITVVKKAYATVEPNGVSVRLPSEFYALYKVIPFHRVTKYGSNWNWGPDRTLQREQENDEDWVRSEVFLYKPKDDEFLIDDVIVSSTERVKQAASRTVDGFVTEMLYLIKRRDREPIDSKRERKSIAEMLSMPYKRLIKCSSIDEPEKELPENKIIKGGRVVEEEFADWASVRVIAGVHNKDWNQLGYGFFNPTNPTYPYANSPGPSTRRDPEKGGWFLRCSAFKIQDPTWYTAEHPALHMAQQVRGLLPDDNVPWDWQHHERGLVLFSKNFTQELDPLVWFPALPYILHKIQSQAAAYSPAAERAHEMFANGMGHMQEMLTDPLIKNVKLPPALRRMQRLAYLAIPGPDSDASARACYDFLKLKDKEPVDQEVLTAQRDRMNNYIQDLKIEAPGLFQKYDKESRALLASSIATLEPESVLLPREIGT